MPFTRTTRVQWTGKDLVFTAGGVEPLTPQITVDADNKLAPGPTLLLAIAAATCTASDIVLILKKMRVDLTRCDVEVAGTRRDEEPKRYIALHLTYTVAGQGVDRAKADRAVQLSLEKYCSVMHSLASDIKVSHDVVLA